MIDQLQAAVESVALCPEHIQRVAAAALLVLVEQDAMRGRISTMRQKTSTRVPREPKVPRVTVKA